MSDPIQALCILASLYTVLNDPRGVSIAVYALEIHLRESGVHQEIDEFSERVSMRTARN